MPKLVTEVANPKENVRQKPHTAGVGNETKADMKGAGVVGDTSLGGAVGHLRSDLDGGVPHMPLHGLRPSGR
jgi:hypothetical protein